MATRVNLPSERRLKAVDTANELATTFEVEDIVVDSDLSRVYKNNNGSWQKLLSGDSISGTLRGWDNLNPNNGLIGAPLRYQTKTEILAYYNANNIDPATGADNDNGGALTYKPSTALFNTVDPEYYDGNDLIFDTVTKAIVKRNSTDYATYVTGLGGADVNPYDLFDVIIDDEFLKTVDTANFPADNLDLDDIVIDSTNYNIYRVVIDGQGGQTYSGIHLRDSILVNNVLPNIDNYAPKSLVSTGDKIVYKEYSSSEEWTTIFDRAELNSPVQPLLSEIGPSVPVVSLHDGSNITVNRTLFTRSRGWSPTTSEGGAVANHADETGQTYDNWEWLSERIGNFHEVHEITGDITSYYNNRRFHNRWYPLIPQEIQPSAEVYNNTPDSAHSITLKNYVTDTFGVLRKIPVCEDDGLGSVQDSGNFVYTRIYYTSGTRLQDWPTATLDDATVAPVARNFSSWFVVGLGEVLNEKTDTPTIYTDDAVRALQEYDIGGTKYRLDTDLANLTTIHDHTRDENNFIVAETFASDVIDFVYPDNTSISGRSIDVNPVEDTQFKPFIRLDTGEQVNTFTLGYRQKATIQTIRPVQELDSWTSYSIGNGALFTLVIESI